jgi:hypothetical protein
MSEADQAATGVKRFRSPPYPSIDLAKAIDRARTLYGKALHHPVQSNVLADAWKYGIKSSGLWATAAAMIQYGLLTDQGSGDSRRFQLTDSAIRIIKDADPASEKRSEAIKRAALAPQIFRELWDQFGGADISDVVVRNVLTLDRREAGKAPFSDEAAKDIIAAFKSTIAFAGVVSSDTLSPPDEGKEADELAVDTSDWGGGTPEAQVKPPASPAPSPPASEKLREVKIMAGERELTAGLLSKDASFRLIVTGQVGVKEIDRLIAKLEIDKEILGATTTILMPTMNGQKAVPVNAEPLSDGRYLLTGNTAGAADSEHWDFRGPVVACEDGMIDGMKGLVAKSNSQ